MDDDMSSMAARAPRQRDRRTRNEGQAGMGAEKVSPVTADQDIETS